MIMTCGDGDNENDHRHHHLQRNIHNHHHHDVTLFNGIELSWPYWDTPLIENRAMTREMLNRCLQFLAVYNMYSLKCIARWSVSLLGEMDLKRQWQWKWVGGIIFNTAIFIILGPCWHLVTGSWLNRLVSNLFRPAFTPSTLRPCRKIPMVLIYACPNIS